MPRTTLKPRLIPDNEATDLPDVPADQIPDLTRPNHSVAKPPPRLRHRTPAPHIAGKFSSRPSKRWPMSAFPGGTASATGPPSASRWRIAAPAVATRHSPGEWSCR